MTREEAMEAMTPARPYLTRFNDGESYHAPFNELARKGYDFDAVNSLDAKGLINDMRTGCGRGEYACLTEAGRERARQSLDR